jgi:putative endopeptidase
MKKEWTTNKWNSYWIYRLLIYVSNYHSKLHTFVFDFFTNKLNNTRKKENIVMNAAYNVSSIMNSTVSKMYIKYYKNQKEISYVTDLIEKIKKEFKSRITKNEWLSPVTKEKALLKIDKLNCVIGYKEKWFEDPDCNFVDDDAIGNNVKYLKWFYDKFNQRLHNDIPNKKYWVASDDMTVYSVNAYYNNVKNEFILPNAILQRPFVDISRNISYNLAYIGFIIAHEMVHGFDTEGSLFDENGIMNYWWTKEDKTHYERLQSDVIDHYESLAKKDDIKIDGKLTLDENIADISALHIIEDTLESYLIENNIFGEKQNTYFKELYYNFARQWRSFVKPKQIKTLLLLDQHSLSKYRVNCVLMRSKRFAQIFDINHSDGMYYDRKLNEIW